MLFFRRTHFPIGTIFLTVVCVIVFVSSLFFSLFGLYLNQHFALGSWQYIQSNPNAIYTLLTSIFSHANFAHIMFNMLALLFMGTFLESIIGTRKFLSVFFITGFVGGLAFLLETAMSNEIIFALGASGAIFGLSGALMILRPNVPVVVFPFPFPMPLWVAMLFNLILIYFLSFFLPIANSAHIGGFLAGLICGYFIKKANENEATKREIKIEWSI